MSKYRYALFHDRITGKGFYIDLLKVRMDKMRSRLFAWASVCEKLSTLKGVKRCMITLTYDTAGTLGKVGMWEAGDIRKFMTALKRRAGLELLAYAWVVEVQKNGNPHYHIIVLYRGSVPYPDKSGMWSKGMSNILFRLQTVYYICKYVGKEYQKDFSKLPKSARAYSVYVADRAMKEELRLLSLPYHLQLAVQANGWEVLAMLIKPEWAKSQYIGSALTQEFRDYLLQEVAKNGEA